MKKSEIILNQIKIYQSQLEQYQNRVDRDLNRNDEDHKKLFDKVDIIEKAVLGIQFNQQNHDKILEELKVLAEQGDKRLEALEEKQKDNDRLLNSIKGWIKWGLLVIGGIASLFTILSILGVF